MEQGPPSMPSATMTTRTSAWKQTELQEQRRGWRLLPILLMLLLLLLLPFQSLLPSLVMISTVQATTTHAAPVAATAMHAHREHQDQQELLSLLQQVQTPMQLRGLLYRIAAKLEGVSPVTTHQRKGGEDRYHTFAIVHTCTRLGSFLPCIEYLTAQLNGQRLRRRQHQQHGQVPHEQQGVHQQQVHDAAAQTTAEVQTSTDILPGRCEATDHQEHQSAAHFLCVGLALAIVSETDDHAVMQIIEPSAQMCGDGRSGRDGYGSDEDPYESFSLAERAQEQRICYVWSLLRDIDPCLLFPIGKVALFVLRLVLDHAHFTEDHQWTASIYTYMRNIHHNQKYVLGGDKEIMCLCEHVADKDHAREHRGRGDDSCGGTAGSSGSSCSGAKGEKSRCEKVMPLINNGSDADDDATHKYIYALLALNEWEMARCVLDIWLPAVPALQTFKAICEQRLVWIAKQTQWLAHSEVDFKMMRSGPHLSGDDSRHTQGGASAKRDIGMRHYGGRNASIVTEMGTGRDGRTLYLRKDEENVQKLRYYLAACVMFRDEGTYLREFLEYHIWAGVEHFFLWEHLSREDDPWKEVLMPYINAGYITLHSSDKDATHGDAMEQCVREHARQSHWLAIIDVDEFLVSVSSQERIVKEQDGYAAHEVLRDFEWSAAAVCVSWRQFCGYPHAVRPKKSGPSGDSEYAFVTQSYLYPVSDSMLMTNQQKVIINTRVAPLHLLVEPRRGRTSSGQVYGQGGSDAAPRWGFHAPDNSFQHNPFDARFLSAFLQVYGADSVPPHAVDEKGLINADGVYSVPPSRSRLQLNHYYSKSMEECHRKASRGYGWYRVAYGDDEGKWPPFARLRASGNACAHIEAKCKARRETRVVKMYGQKLILQPDAGKV